MKNIDVIFGVGAWAVAALNRYHLVCPLRGDPFDLGLFFLPFIWLLCVSGLLITRKRRLLWYWWVAVSLPYISSYWLLFLVNPFWYTLGDRNFRILAPF